MAPASHVSLEVLGISCYPRAVPPEMSKPFTFIAPDLTCVIVCCASAATTPRSTTTPCVVVVPATLVMGRDSVVVGYAAPPTGVRPGRACVGCPAPLP